MKINVIGLGYIGLPTTLMFASKGFNVVGTDYNSQILEKLNKGIITFEEKGLDELFQSAIEKKVVFQSEYISTDVYIVAVPTPYCKESKKIDPKYVISAVNTIVDICPDNAIMVIESTVSPGTIDKYIRPLVDQNKTHKKINLIHAPERIIPGNMVYELENNSRTIGTDDPKIGEFIADMYKQITNGDVVVTDIKSAEMTKVVENTYRAVNIAFANELAKICNESGMDVYEVIRICNMHPRVNILNPGPGVGGHCISVDPWFLVGDYPELTNVIGQSMHINESMPHYVFDKINLIMKEKGLKDYRKVGLYGLSYKENVDDYRESPTLQLLDIQKNGKKIPFNVFDPFITEDIVDNQIHNFDEFLSKSDIVVILVKHNHIINHKKLLKGKVVFDTQNIMKEEDIYKL